MKKEASGKKGKWLWLVLGIVAVLAVAGVVLALILGGGRGEQQGGRPVLYWNVDKEANIDPDTGLSLRKPAEDGNYYIRFACNGEQIELPVADKRLVNYIDGLDLMGLGLDDNGFIVDIYDPEEIANVVGDALYVQSVSGDTIIANTSVLMNGKRVTIKMSDEVAIYNVSGTGEFVGAVADASELEIMDTIGVYGTWIEEDSEEESVITHVFLISKPEQSPVYFRTERKYNTSLKSTTRVPDENGAYTIDWYVDGEIVSLKCKDKALVTTIDKQDREWSHYGLKFDEEGYIIDTMDSALSSRTLIQCERYDITELDEDGNYVATSLVKNNGAFVQGTIGEDCIIYDISSAAKSEGQVNRKVDSLQMGDRVCIWTDTTGKPVLIYITTRRVDVPTFWNCTRSYSSTTKQTKRTPNANGYYEIDLLPAGSTKKTKYYTKDINIATAIDKTEDRVVGLVVGEGNIVERVYNIDAVFGRGYYFRGYFVTDAQVAVATFKTPSGGKTTYNGVFAADAKIYNVSTCGTYGAETALEYGDRVYAGRTPVGEVAYAYITRRMLGSDAMYARLSSQKYDSKKKETTRTPNEEGYYVYQFANKGKVVTLKTNDKTIANYIDSQSYPGVALEVKGDIILKAHSGVYAMGGERISGYYVQSIENGTIVLKNSAGTVKTQILPENYEAYNVGNTFEQYKGEKTTVQVGDYVTAYRGMGKDLAIIFVRARETAKIAWPVERMYNTSTSQTTRKPAADGWYYIDLAIDGKVSTYKTKNEAIATRVDSNAGAFGVNIKGDEIVSVSAASYVKNVKTSGVTDYTVSAVKGNQITAIYTLGHTSNTGTTKSFSVSGAKIYDVNAGAGDKFGAVTNLQVGDKIRTYVDENGNVLYAFVLAHCTRAGGYQSYCEHCDKVVYWNAYTNAGAVATYDTHYYLASDIKLDNQLRVYAESRDFETVLDLNGYTMFREGGRAIRVHYGETLTIMDSSAKKTGTIRTRNSAEQGVVMVYGSSTYGVGVVNMLGGTITMDSDEGVTKYPRLSGLVGVDAGVFNMKGGELRNGVVKSSSEKSAYGAAVWNSNGEFNMSGGKITGGKAYGSKYTTSTGKTSFSSSYGANIYSTGSKAKVTISGGVIENGVAGRGGNIYIAGGQCYITGGTIQNGTAAYKLADDTQISYSEDGRGGNIYNGGKLYISGGTITGGSTLNGSNRGGNIYGTGTSDTINISDKAVITNGKSKSGNNIFLMYTNLVVSGGTISNGEVTSGNAIYAHGTSDNGYSTVTISGGTIEGTVKMAGGTEAGAKYADYRAVLYLAGGTIKDTLDASNAQAIYVSGKPVVNLITIGSNLLNISKMESGASVTIDTVGIFSKPVENATAYTGYFHSTSEDFQAVATDKNELKFAHPDAVVGPCAHCDADVDWMPWNGGTVGNGHYFLEGDVQLTAAVEIAAKVSAVIDLRGYTITAAENARCFYVSGGLVIMDTSEGETGVITGGRATRGGNIYINSGSFTLMSGTITGGVADNALGTTSTNGRGGNICANGGELILMGGTVTGGKTSGGSGYGGNIYATVRADVTISGDAVVTGGNSKTGGNIYLMYANMVMDGGEITDGTASGNGKNIYAKGDEDGGIASLTINDGKIANGSIYLTGGVKAATAETEAVDYRTVLVIAGGELDCTIEAVKVSTFDITGNPVIKELALSEGVVMNANELTEGASIKVSGAGVISVPYADQATAEALIANGYIAAISVDEEITVNDKYELVISVKEVETITAYCEHCQSDAEWMAWIGGTVGNGHYFLESDVQLTAAVDIASSIGAVIDLRGYTITAAENARCFYVSGDLVIMDTSEGETGVITGGRATRGGNINISNGSFTLMSGTITGGVADNALGTTSSNGRGGNICVNGGELILMGGTVSGGKTSGGSGYGGNIYATVRADVTISGDAVVTGGNSKTGGNIYLMYANMVMDGGEITDGTASGAGKNIYAKGDEDGGIASLTINDGKIANGSIYLTGGVKAATAETEAVDYRTVLVIAGGELDCKIQAAKVSTLDITGNPVIAELELGEGVVMNAAELTEGASIKVSGAGVISVPYADNATAEALIANGYIAAFNAEEEEITVNANNELVIGEKAAEEEPEMCPCGCGALADVEWENANEYMEAMKTSESTRFTENVHLQLRDNLNITEIYGVAKQITVGGSGYKVSVVLDLNGFTWSSDYRLYINSNNIVTVLDTSEEGTGTMTCPGRGLQFSGGVIYNGGTLNIYGGTFTQPANGSNVRSGGVIASSGRFNMYGGTIIGGQALDDGDTLGSGGNVFISGGTFNLIGGTISGGTASTGSNVYVAAGATFNHEGGTIEDKDNTYVKAEA